MTQEEKLKSLIKKLIEHKTKGTDKYVHNGSTWLIFSNDKKWVVELTKEKTLWFNYYFFKRVFEYFSLDVIENQHIITEWVEETIINPVKKTRSNQMDEPLRVEDTIQNGVRNTEGINWYSNESVEDTIKNGVKDIGALAVQPDGQVEDTIQNGVKKTKRSYEGSRKQRTKDTIQNGVKVTYSDKIPHQYDWTNQFTDEIEDIIENGVKHTEYGDWEDGDERLDDIIKNGIKETKSEVATREWKAGEVINGGIRKTEGGVLFDESKIDTVISEGIKETHDDVMPHTGRVEGVIKNGVKECVPVHHILYNPMDFSVEYRENHRLDDVASVLEKGIKEVQPLPAQDGNRDWGNYYYRQEDRTKPHTKHVDDVITNGKKISEN